MNVEEFAEQIVFGKTLEDKLTPPRRLSFSRKSTARASSIPSPGRASGLQMHTGTGVSQPPQDRDLDHPDARGRLLHFLANHELLATELMALVLLKFPNAPHAFQRGVLVTLQEEQEHTQLYLNRMQECGVEFGSFPLSGHFWRVVEPMNSPMDFVSRLSLTFEQANLDYSRHFAEIFRRQGDLETAEILERIYQDEIGHVQHGLQWFRQWKDPACSDWEAYENVLQFPMSPQRARGPKCEFNREGRRQAGLSDDFIDAIEVYRQSRGRPPCVRWFDPGAEAELAGQAPRKDHGLLYQLAVDLEGVMLAFSKQDDVQLVHRMPSIGFRKQLLKLGFELPEFIPIGDSQRLGERKLTEISPWSWTPQSHEIARPMGATSRVASAEWQPRHARLFRKSWCATRLNEWLSRPTSPRHAGGTDGATPEFFGPEWCESNFTTQVSDTLAVQAAVAQLADAGYKHALFKQDLATAGRAQRRLDCKGLTRQDQDWLNSIWAAGQAGVLEPQLDRLVDLSFLWDKLGQSTTPPFLGWTRQLVTRGRRYCGTRLSRPFEDCESDVKRFLLANDCQRLQTTRRWIETHLWPELRNVGFEYYFGVDAFVYRDHAGALKIHPLVELNPRLTMGHVALGLRRRIAPTTRADLRIFTRPEWDRLQRSGRIPSQRFSSDERWQAGVIELCEIEPQTKLIPAVVVGLGSDQSPK